jgi:hypothetical protein
VGTNLETTEGIMNLVESRIPKVLRKNEYRVLNTRAGYGEGSEMNVPLARSVIGGLSSSLIYSPWFLCQWYIP